MNRTRIVFISLGCAYISLAIISVSCEIPTYVVNSLSLGAMFFAIGNLIDTKRIQGKRIDYIEILEKCEDKISYISEIIKKMTETYSPKPTRKAKFIDIVVLLLYISGFFIIVVGACIGNCIPFFQSNKFGTFLSIASLGVMLLSEHVQSEADYQDEIRNLIEMNRGTLDLGVFAVQKLTKSIQDEEWLAEGKDNLKEE